MSWLSVTLAMYRTVLRRAADRMRANWYVFASLFAYAAIMRLAAELAVFLGFLGGFVLSLASAACMGSFLSVIEMVVRTGKVSREDFFRSWGVYLWDVVGVTFVLWLFFALVRPALATLPQGPPIILGIVLVLVVILNVVPELIYLGRCSSLELLAQSVSFIGDNWIEWFPMTAGLAVLVYAVGVLPMAGVLAWLQSAVVALLVCFAMVARGLLFLELHGSSRRGRAFRHRMGA